MTAIDSSSAPGHGCALLFLWLTPAWLSPEAPTTTVSPDTATEPPNKAAASASDAVSLASWLAATETTARDPLASSANRAAISTPLAIGDSFVMGSRDQHGGRGLHGRPRHGAPILLLLLDLRGPPSRRHAGHTS